MNMNNTSILAGAEPKRTSTRRYGKIGRMTSEIRDYVNQSLLEGCTYPKIISRLEERGHPGITPHNLSAWARGGYQDWLRDREQASQFRARCEAIVTLYTSLPPETRAKMGDINNFAAALQFNQILQQNNPGDVGELLHQKPETFFRLADFITFQGSEETRRKKLDLESKKFQFRLAKMGVNPNEALGALLGSHEGK